MERQVERCFLISGLVLLLKCLINPLDVLYPLCIWTVQLKDQVYSFEVELVSVLPIVIEDKPYLVIDIGDDLGFHEIYQGIHYLLELRLCLIVI